jgi:hypothetical protein
MAWLDAPAASGTPSDVDVEPPSDGFTRNLHLELVIHMVLLGIAATVGALRGQGDVDDLIGFLFGQGPMSLGAVVLAGLSTWGLWVVFGRPFGEGGGLTFLGTDGRFQQSFELGNTLFEFGDPPFKSDTIGTSLACSRIVCHDIHIGYRVTRT